jgi:hypothetical protein
MWFLIYINYNVEPYLYCQEEIDAVLPSLNIQLFCLLPKTIKKLFIVIVFTANDEAGAVTSVSSRVT